MLSKAEAKIKFLILIDISSDGFCLKTNQDLATLAETTLSYVDIVLSQMVRNREIDMSSYQNERRITYPKKLTGKLF
jgi:hypothetical protein